jgi:uncharacterized protein YndB with AHSA1/START domain
MESAVHARSRLRSIGVARRFAVPAPRVFEAWVNPAIAGKWLFATALHPMAEVEIDARPRGSFHFVERRDGAELRYFGSYLKIAPPRQLEFMLAMNEIPGARTRVSVEFVPLAMGCKVALTHNKVPAEFAHDIEARWTGMLYGLAETLADGNPSTPAPQDKEKR